MGHHWGVQGWVLLAWRRGRKLRPCLAWSVCWRRRALPPPCHPSQGPGGVTASRPAQYMMACTCVCLCVCVCECVAGGRHCTGGVTAQGASLRRGRHCTGGVTTQGASLHRGRHCTGRCNRGLHGLSCRSPPPQRPSPPVAAPLAGAFKAMELKGHKSQVLCAAISADNKRAATASKDGTLRVWNVSGGAAGVAVPTPLLMRRCVPAHGAAKPQYPHHGTPQPRHPLMRSLCWRRTLVMLPRPNSSLHQPLPV